ncbi:MAG: hypothetical protein AAFS07_07145 [Pseudomonadota bacterium]
MARFDAKSLRTVQDFGGALSLVPVEGPDGSFTFIFEKMGTLTLVASGEDRLGAEGPIMISLARTPGRVDGRLMEALFAAAGYESQSNLSIHAGLARDGSAILTLAVPRDRFDLSTLEGGIDRLSALFDKVQANA